jgi:hypothetical protein
MIEDALREAEGLISGPTGAAAKLGIPRQTLESKIRKLGINLYRTIELAAVCAQDDSMAMGARKAFEESRHEIPKLLAADSFPGLRRYAPNSQEGFGRVC